MENIKRVAVVTGGTRGMGKGISIELARRGNIVCPIYHSNKKAAEETLEILLQYSPSSCIIQGDVSKESEVKRIINEIGEKFGRIDILVNNAGIFDFSYIDEMSEEYLDRVINTNFKSQFFMIKHTAPYMKKQQYGRIVGASSISGSFADCGLVAYAASKAGVNMLTKIAAAELGPFGITVNAYAPGIIATDMTAEMIKERGEEQVRDLCLKEFGTPQDVGALVGFLTSPEARYITGEIIGIDGGLFKVQNAYLAYERSQKES